MPSKGHKVDLNNISAETLEEIKKATSGITSGTGIHGADLSDLISLVPVNTPFRDRLARTSPAQGAKFAEWEALTNVNNAQPNPATAFDQAAPLVLANMQDVTALYAKVGAGYTVTQDAITIARGYADAKAVAIFNAINQYKIGEDRKAIGGQNFALATPATPTVVAATTGGTIPLSTAVNVKVAARAASNFFWGGSGIASAQGTVTTGAGTSTNTATASVVAVPGAVAYDWFVAGFYYTTTTVNTVLITNIPVANNTVVPAITGLSSTLPTAVPVADATASALDFNGLLPSLIGDYATGGATGLVSRGSGISSGAYYRSLDGATLTVSGQSIAELDTLNAAIYNQVQLSPDRYMVSPDQAGTLSGAFLVSGASTVYLQPADSSDRAQAVLGGRVEYYVNKITGEKIEIELNPNLPSGTLIATRDNIPFPNSNITKSMEIRTQNDLVDWEYPAARQTGAGGGPRFDGEIYSMETFVNRAPVAMGVIQNITKS